MILASTPTYLSHQNGRRQWILLKNVCCVLFSDNRMYLVQYNHFKIKISYTNPDLHVCAQYMYNVLTAIETKHATQTGDIGINQK